MSKHNKNKREDENASTEAQEQQQEEISGNQQAEAAQDGSKESKEEASAKEDNGKNLLEEAQKQVQEEKNRYVYLMAEFDNYRRRVSQAQLDLIDTAAKGVINDLLPVVDNFERALKSMEESEASDSAKMGTELIYKQLIDVLKKKGVTEIEALGKELDTDEQEAVAQIPAPSEDKKGKVVDVVVKGYKLNGKVIRFAKVVIGV